jgi:CDGSH-type Zn-finger protein
MVTVTKYGPYAVTGGIGLVEQAMGEGASPEHYALCRCGGSKIKPFTARVFEQRGLSGFHGDTKMNKICSGVHFPDSEHRGLIGKPRARREVR